MPKRQWISIAAVIEPKNECNSEDYLIELNWVNAIIRIEGIFWVNFEIPYAI